MENLSLHIESLIFSANPSISFDEIRTTLEAALSTTFSDELIAENISLLMEKFASDQYSFEIMEIAGGFRFMTKGAYHNTIGTFLKLNAHKKLSKSALETLSIVAYKQPVSKAEIESIRGVNSDYTIPKLLEKDLVEITGRSDGPGKPLLYGTTSKFTDYFGLKSIADLPKLREIDPVENQIGEQAPIEAELFINNSDFSKEEE